MWESIWGSVTKISKNLRLRKQQILYGPIRWSNIPVQQSFAIGCYHWPNCSWPLSAKYNYQIILPHPTLHSLLGILFFVCGQTKSWFCCKISHDGITILLFLMLLMHNKYVILLCKIWYFRYTFFSVEKY